MGLEGINSYLWGFFEDQLIPSPNNRTTCSSGLFKAISAVALLTAGSLTGSLVGVKKVLGWTASFFTSQNQRVPLQVFPAILKDSRLWSTVDDIEKNLLEEPPGADDPNFLNGLSTCTYQDSGSKHCPNSQWARHEERCLKEENRSIHGPNLFELYKTPAGRQEVIRRLLKMEANTYRFSIEWSHINPTPVWTEESYRNLQIYIDLCIDLRNAGIQPMVTLHHFSEPQWFHDLGSFEKEENIQHFARFAERVFPAFTQEYKGKPLVEYFCTINEPAIEAFSRYVRGSFSPGIIGNFHRAGNFLKGALKAHCAVYNILKRNAPPSVQIGLIHQYLRFDAANFLVHPATKYLTHLVNEVPLNFFRTGKFELKMPFCHILEQCTKPMMDFIGVQYYARPVIGLTGSTSYHEPMTQMPFREDPEGIYEAIVETYNAVQKPVIVTETGISTHDGVQRRRYMVRALFSTREAAKVIGPKNLKGILGWSFTDNAEWDMGMSPQAFGSFAINKNAVHVRIHEDPKPGAEIFRDVALARKKLLNTD